MAQHSSLAIANEFIKKANSDGCRDVTQMKLQKLVYLAHGWSLAGLDNPMIGDEIEAWEYGPVIPKLYHAAKRFGREPIRQLLNWGDDTPFRFDDGGVATTDLTQNEQDIIETVWEIYGEFAAFQLSALTHESGTPWSQTFQPGGRNLRISDDRIKSHFSGLLTPA